MKRVDKIKLICSFCGDSYLIHPYRRNMSRFCSASCHGRYRFEKHKDRFFRDKHGINHPMYGKHLSDDWRKKISKNHANVSGENSGTWKGGITPINEKIRKSKEYILWRTAIFIRDDYTCQKCGERGINMNADHIKPFALYPDIRFAIDNGQTLCYWCHREKTSSDMIMMRKDRSIWQLKIRN